jgi:peptide/nickel transport system substrate-binding protein
VIGMTTEVASISAMAEAFRAAATAIGLKPKFKAVSAQNYGYFFSDPKAREGVDCFDTLNYGDYADPAALLSTVVLPDGSQNFSGYQNAEMVSLLDKARGTADPNERASLVAQAEQLAAEDLPWIPNIQPVQVTVMSKSLSGTTASFAYMFAPWADQLGGTGN